MTIYDFEAGTPGNAATLANTGAAALSAGGGNAIAIDNVGVWSGANSLSFTAGSTSFSCYADFNAESGTPTTLSFAVAITLSPDGYSVDTTLQQVFLTGTTTTVGRILVTTAGSLRFQDRGAAHTLTLADVSAKYGQTIVVRGQLQMLTTTTGVATIRYYATPATAVGSPTAEQTASNLNLGTAEGFGNHRIGILTTQTSLSTGRKTTFDYYVVVSGTSWIASPTAAANPTANAGVDQYGQAGTTFALTGSGTIGSGGGSITTYAWTISAHEPGAPTASIATPAAAATNVSNLTPGVYTATLTVTQVGGLTGTDTAVLWVYPASGTSVTPYSVVRETGITREGSAARDEDALSDTDPASLLKWPDPPTSQKVTIRWNPCGPNSPVINLYGAKVGSGTVTRTVNHYWEDGTTLLDGPYTGTFTVDPLPAGLAPAAVTALGSTPANRRQLVTVISDLGS